MQPQRVQMITLAAGPNGALLPGHKYGPADGLDQKTMTDLCKGGYAVPVKEKRETATAGPTEKAVPFEIPGVSRAVVQEMAARGITPANLAEMPKKVLKNVPGLGKAALEKIETFVNETASGNGADD